MKTLKRKTLGPLVSFAVAALMISAAMGIRSGAQSANPASNTSTTNQMSRYLEAQQESLVSGTAATNLSDVERSRLMSESIRTNLAAQLWFRTVMMGHASGTGARMAVEIRALESLRAGRSNDAIRDLEETLDGDIIVLAEHLRAGEEGKMFKPTRQPLEALQWAKDYRLKFPHKSGNPATDERVKHGLSYPDKE
jgi:hypothetical protein